MTRTRFFASAIAAATLAITATIAQPPTPPQHPQKALAAIAGQQLCRAALIDSRAIIKEDSGPADAKYLAALLRDAANLDPANPAILRYAAIAAAQCGDLQGSLALDKALVTLNPADTTAQLELIRTRVALCQSAEERLAILDGFIGARGESLDPAVRSRLAVDAAALRREQGDTAGFVKDLTAATTFDPSNPDAAALALHYYVSRAKDAEGRFELIANTLLASPTDASIHGAIASELASAGATEQAIRFYDNSFALIRRTGGAKTIDDLERELRQRADYLVQLWRTQGPQVVVKELNDAVDVPRREAQVEIDIANVTGKPTDKLRKPGEIRNPIAFERLRAAAAFAAGDRSSLDRALTDFDASITAMPPDEPGRPAAMCEVAFLRALTHSGDISADLKAVRATMAAAPESLARLEAWQKLRSGSVAAGRSLFQAMKTDTLATLALLAFDVENTPAGDNAQARAISDRLAALAADNPASPISAWAYTTYQARNGGKAPPPSARAEKFTAMAAGIPVWLDDIAKEPSRFITVQPEPPKAAFAPLEPAIVNIRVSNNTPVPLSIGAGQAIDDQLLVIASVDIGGTRAPDLGRSEVTSLTGRLRLLPRETATFAVWPDPGFGGWGVQNYLTKAARLRYNVIQGFRVVDGTPRPGPSGLSFDAGPYSRASITLGEVGPVVAEIASLQDADFALALLHARLFLLTRDKPLSVEQSRSLVTALGERYKKGTPVERIAILLLTPTPRLATAAAELERTVAQVEETDPVVARVALLTRSDDATSPLLAKFRAFPDPGVQEAVKLIEARLAADRPMFARAAPAVQNPAPPPGAKPPAPPAGGAPAETPPALPTPPAAPSAADPSTPPVAPSPTPPKK